MDVIRKKLDNGLVVLSRENHAAPVVALQAWVKIGSADESEDIAGIAHVHEHMLFKGTQKRGVGEIAMDVESAGGEINAWTSFDQTVYHIVLAADELETGIDILSDALQNSAFDKEELGRELEVVLEEIRRSEDMPSRRVSRALFSSAYKKHPYRRPVIGYVDTVNKFTREGIVDFFQKNYRPSRIVFTAVGDFDSDELQTLVQKYFGKWDDAGVDQLPPREVEPAQEDLRLHILREDVKESHFTVAWHIPSISHEDIPAIDALSVLLGHGDSSRLFTEIRRRRDLVNDVYAYAFTPADAGLFMLGAGLRSENLREALKAMLCETYALSRRLVCEEELAKTKVQILSESAYQSETVQGLARRTGFMEVVAGSLDFEEQYNKRVEALTPEDIRKVAEKYLNAEPSIVIQLPEADEPPTPDEIKEIVDTAFAPTTSKALQKKSKDDLGVLRVDLDNGATLLVRQVDSPVVAARIVALGGVRWENREKSGLGSLYGSLWGLATEDLTTEAMARRLASLGGGISGFFGRNTAGLRAEFVREHASDGIDLLLQNLLRPAFPALDLEREKATLIERARNRDDHPSGVAFDTFMSELFPTHPYGFRLSGYEDSLKKLNESDVTAFRRFVNPGRLIVAVEGALDPDEVAAQISDSLYESSSSVEVDAPALDPVLSEFRQIRKKLDKKQAHILVGTQGTTVNDEDRYAMEVLSTLLSGQGGRLFLDLRDKQSLAYAISSSNVEGLDPGYFMVYVGSSPDKEEQVLTGVYEHLERLVQELASAEEVARAHRYLVGTHSIDLQRGGARAMLMALGDAYGLGYDVYTHYAERIRAVDAKKIQEVAQTYLRRDRLLEVVVGPNT